MQNAESKWQSEGNGFQGARGPVEEKDRAEVRDQNAELAELEAG
jgi:hypothetical protein